jgi:hypothetical protein
MDACETREMKRRKFFSGSRRKAAVKHLHNLEKEKELKIGVEERKILGVIVPDTPCTNDECGGNEMK